MPATKLTRALRCLRTPRLCARVRCLSRAEARATRSSSGNLLLALATLLVCHNALLAFPLDPVRIYARGRGEPARGTAVVASVYQGGTLSELGSGKLLYREAATVNADEHGEWGYWLGEVNPTDVRGELRGPEFGLQHELFIELVVNGDEPYRRPLGAIDNAYVLWQKPREIGESEALRGKFFKQYAPKIERFTPDLVRTGRATLFPDGRLQAETGEFISTTGTQTSGVQELFDYCERHHVDGYIVGGAIPNRQQVVYVIWKPLQLPARQGFRLDTGAITLQFMPELGDQPGLTLNSMMMCDIRIRGLIHYLGKGYALAIHPGGLLPLDKFVDATIVDSALYVTAIACSGAKGAVVIDGSVNFSRFTFNEINHGNYGIHVRDSAAFSNCRVTCKHIHGQLDTGVLVEAGAQNLWEVNLNCDAKDPRGIVTSGKDDQWFVNVNSRSEPSFTFERTARGNQVFAGLLNGGWVNHAENPVNRIYPSPNGAPPPVTKLGFHADTPEVPASGIAVINRHPYPVVVLIKNGGSVHEWGITDPFGTREMIPAPLAAGQSVYLGPAEAVTLHYADAPPTWRWRAVP